MFLNVIFTKYFINMVLIHHLKKVTYFMNSMKNINKVSLSNYCECKSKIILSLLILIYLDIK